MMMRGTIKIYKKKTVKMFQQLANTNPSLIFMRK